MFVSVAVLCALAFLPAPAASADSSTVGTSAEAWYTVLPQCVPGVQCLPVTPPALPDAAPSPDPFPKGTLHVAMAAGQEVSRAYLKLDLGSLPSGAQITGGTLTLPVAGATAGTVNAGAANIAVCFMVAPFSDGVSGSLQPPPTPDCSTFVIAKLLTLPSGSSFVADLAAFAARWAPGEPNEGLAIVAQSGPAGAAPDSSTWLVAFNGKDAAAGPKISASVDYTFPAIEVPPLATPPPPLVFRSGAPGTNIPPAAEIGIPALPQTPALRRLPAGLVTRGFEYAGIFVLPLVALVLGWAVSYSLTRDVEPRRA